ncbi:MAG: hypothetical protein LC772_04030, partial [Chloroflexi bacterium]|nr:hypothetical protein [Chloroflexota bacterium]
MDNEAIQMRLAECIAWCAPRAMAGDPAALRTRELLWLALYDVHEVFDPQPPPAWAGEPDSFNTYDHARLDVVETVVARRAEALRAGGEYPMGPARGLAGGTLLAFHPMTMQD